MSDLDVIPPGRVALLVEFRYRSAKAAFTTNRYTSAMSDLTVGGNSYASIPAMECDFPAIDGSAKTPEATLTIKEVLPLTRIKQRIPYASIVVTIKRVNLDDQTDAETIFAGWMGNPIFNAGGRPETVKVSVEGWMTRANVELGIPANGRCWATFGDITCCKTPYDKLVTISGIDGFDVTLTGLDHTDDATFWNRGYLLIDGAPVLIRFYGGGATVTLNQRLPALSGWTPTQVYAVEGCDKRHDTCKNHKSNEGNFSGFGIKMLDYNPLYQQRSG